MFIVLNKNKETDKLLIFLHVLKTGGTTLHSIIDKEYEENYAVWNKNSPHTPMNRIPWSSNIPMETKKRIEVLRGHFIFGIHNSLPQKEFLYITFLRNPIERVISAYYYALRAKGDKVLNNIFNQLTLFDFITREEFDHYNLNWTFSTSNLQTRVIAGKPKGKLNEEDLKIAKNNLEKYFSVVGITERFDDSLSVLKNELDWNIKSYIKENVASNKPSRKKLPIDIIDILKRKNEKDIDLYKFANILLDEKIQKLKS